MCYCLQILRTLCKHSAPKLEAVRNRYRSPHSPDPSAAWRLRPFDPMKSKRMKCCKQIPWLRLSNQFAHAYCKISGKRSPKLCDFLQKAFLLLFIALL